MDDNGLSDPYVKLKIGKTKYKTKSKSKTLNPVWRQSFDFELHEQNDILQVSCWDKDTVGSDDMIGKCVLS